MTDNKLISEFMGYKLARCSNGLAWDSPYQKAVDDVFKIHGRLWRENDSYYQWNTSWDWLMPVAQKIEKYLWDNQGKVGYFDECLQSNDREVRYQAVVEFIKWYNQNK